MRENRIFALGFFDGVHLGHQALLRACVELAKERDAKTAAITFDQHPQSLYTCQTPPLLGTLQDRFHLLTHYGMEHIYAFPVTEEVMSTNWRAFLDQLMDYGATGFVCGHDFRFGHKGEGNAHTLQDYCAQKQLPCIIVPEQIIDGKRISSSHIRSLMEAGEPETAAKFLGHPHILSGEVVSGRQIGRTIGVPTANILIPDGVVVPTLGVYATECLVDGVRYKAVTNIGSRPTVEGHQVRAESWLLDFEGDLYGKHMTVCFHKFLRPEQKFAGLEELKQQIQLDAEAAKTLLR